MKKALARVATPGVRRSLRQAGTLADATNISPDCRYGSSDLTDAFRSKTPTRSNSFQNRTPSTSRSTSESEEFNNATVIMQEMLEEMGSDEENFESVDAVSDMDKSQSFSAKKKGPAALVGNAWHRQVRRMSVSNSRRMTEMKFPASKFDFAKEKSRRSCTVSKPALNSSLKLLKMDRRASFRVSKNKLNDSKKIGANCEEKKILGNILQSQKFVKKPTVGAVKKTVPSIVTTEKGIEFKEEEVLHFGIPLEIKKKNTKVVPFSFETRNKELQLKKEQRLKKLQDAAEQKEDKPKSANLLKSTTRPTNITSKRAVQNPVLKPAPVERKTTSILTRKPTVETAKSVALKRQAPVSNLDKKNPLKKDEATKTSQIKTSDIKDAKAEKVRKLQEELGTLKDDMCKLQSQVASAAKRLEKIETEIEVLNKQDG